MRREDFIAFLESRRETADAPRCHCGVLMVRAQGIVPIWLCSGCRREVPRV